MCRHNTETRYGAGAERIRCRPRAAENVVDARPGNSKSAVSVAAHAKYEYSHAIPSVSSSSAWSAGHKKVDKEAERTVAYERHKNAVEGNNVQTWIATTSSAMKPKFLGHPLQRTW